MRWLQRAGGETDHTAGRLSSCSSDPLFRTVPKFLVCHCTVFEINILSRISVLPKRPSVRRHLSQTLCTHKQNLTAFTASRVGKHSLFHCNLTTQHFMSVPTTGLCGASQTNTPRPFLLPDRSNNSNIPLQVTVREHLRTVQICC